ncbi:MAG: hypothetical protein J6P05_04650 [Lachnospiraceae bacterium]|nr:hypothetical protein [Lachnospiraceae bacterium]
MWKDTLFAGIVLLFTAFFYYHEHISHKWDKIDLALLYLIGTSFCLFRTNGFYAFLIFLIVSIAENLISWLKDNNRAAIRQRIKLIIPLSLTIITVIFVKGPIMGMAQVKPGDPIESLSIPAQQIAAVIKEDGYISDEDREALSELVDIDKVKEKYSPALSDNIKNLVRETGHQELIPQNKAKYLKTYINIGIKNPGIYLMAFVRQTRGYWYHNPGIYWVIARRIAENDIGLSQAPLIGGLLGKLIDYVPAAFLLIYYITWSSAASVWMILIMLLFAILTKKDRLAYYPALAVICTLLIATPVANEFRYAYSAFLCLPMLFFITFRSPSEI